MTCLRCEYVWQSRTALPRQCPRCKSPRWNKERINGKRESSVGLDYDGVGSPERRQSSIEHGKIGQRRQSGGDGARFVAGAGTSDVSQRRSIALAALASIPAAVPVAEIPLCNVSWWEDGNQYQCLMDRGHKSPKHGMHGMVRNITD